MDNLLYQYCATYLRETKVSNRKIVDKCTRIFLIDGQQIPFEPTLVSLAGRRKAANAPVLGRSNAKGEDSIHFQQLRAYSLSQQLLKHADALSGPGGLLRVAIIGGGFSGLTAALTILADEKVDVHVTLFEHHHEIMPRFAGAYGRRVHPYHHLFFPSDLTRVDAQSNVYWACPIRGGNAGESGGIDGILSWKPGRVEDVVKQVSKKASAKLREYENQKRLTIRLNSKVTSIDPVLNNERISNIHWLDFAAARDVSSISIDEVDNDRTDNGQFDVVILAPGGSRDAVSLVGQSNAEYWNPLRILNAPPLPWRYEIAIIGSGNSAASEVFNYLIPGHDFVGLLATLQEWSKSDAPYLRTLLAADYQRSGNTAPVKRCVSLEQFKNLISADEWRHLDGLIRTKLVRTKKLMSKEMLRITMFVRSLDPVFDDMNPVNKFLVMLLCALEFVEIRNLYKEMDLRPGSASRTYRVVLGKSAVRLFVSKKREIYPLNGGKWSQIINCSGANRAYHEAFVGTILRADTPQDIGYLTIGRKPYMANNLRELLKAKQALITPHKKRKPKSESNDPPSEPTAAIAA